MRKGVSGVSRIAAILSVSLVALMATGTTAGASTFVKSTYNATGTGSVLGVTLTLPSVVTSAVNGVLGAVPLPSGSLSLPSTIDEQIAWSQSFGRLVNEKVSGNSVGRMFYGTLDKTVLEPVVGAVFPDRLGKGLPVANAVLGGLEHQVDSLANLNIPSALPLIQLGLMKVSADSTPASNLKAALSSGTASLANLRVDLTPQLKDLLKQTVAPLTDLTDNTLIPELNGLLGGITDTLNKALDTTVTLQLPKLADLLDRPLLSLEKISTNSATDAIGRVRSAEGFSQITNLNIFGTSATNALVHLDLLTSKATASVDGTRTGAKADAIQKILGLSILGNEIAIFNDKITVLGKEIPVSLTSVTDVLDKVTGLVGDTLGLKITTLANETYKAPDGSSASAAAHTLAISFHPKVQVLGGLGLDISAPMASAQVGAQSTSVKGLCIGKGCLPTTGIPDTTFMLVGPLLIGSALLVRKFALVK